MFKTSAFTGDLSSWKFLDLADALQMFSGAPFRGDLSRWKFAIDALLDEFIADSDVLEYAQPSLYHWMRAGENLDLLAHKPQWQ